MSRGLRKLQWGWLRIALTLALEPRSFDAMNLT